MSNYLIILLIIINLILFYSFYYYDLIEHSFLIFILTCTLVTFKKIFYIFLFILFVGLFILKHW